MNTKRTARRLLARLTRPLAAIGRRLGGRDEEEDGAAAPSEPFDDRLVEDGFTLTLEAMLAEDAGRFQVRLQIISLVQFREAVGDKWTRLSEKVMLIAESVIAQHLGPGNVCGRQGQDFFVLLFRTVPHEEGRRRAILIARELGTRLLGNQFIAGDQPLALAAEVGLHEALDGDGRLRPSVLADAIAETRLLVSRDDPGGDRRSSFQNRAGDGRGTADHADDLFAGGSDRPPQVTPPSWRATDITREIETVDPDWRPLDTGRQRTAAEPEWTPLAPEHKRPARAEPEWTPLAPPPAGADRAPPAPPLPADAVLSLSWRPTWVAAGETIGAALAMVSRRDHPDQPGYEGGRAYPAGGGDAALQLDRVVIAGVARELSAPDAPRPAPTLILPLHWASASSARRLSLLAPLADLPEGPRLARLSIELFGCPDDLTARDLAATIQALRPLTRDIRLRVALDQPRAERARDCGAVGIGVDLAEMTLSSGDDERLLDMLAAFHQKAEAAGLAVHAWGLRRRAVVVGTVMGGYAMINGPGLMKDLPRPPRLLPAPRARFGG